MDGAQLMASGLDISANRLRDIKTFPSLVKYLRDDLDWPIDSDDFEDLTFEWEPEELGIDPASAAKIQEIKQLRPLASGQPWGIFFLKFEPRRLPVVALRRILRALVIRKRVTATKAQQKTWQLHDLLFISLYGAADHREIAFAHFAEEPDLGDLPTLRVLGWDDENTALHLEHADQELRSKLRWPADEGDLEEWRRDWSSAFTLRHGEVIRTSKVLAERLAELAQKIRKRVNAVLEIESERGPLRRLHKSFREALIHDLSEDDFADMYAQTISYGLLTARISRPAGIIGDNLRDMVPVTNPFLRDLLETFLTVGGRKGKIEFDELGVSEVVQMLRDADMEAVLRDFGDRNPQEDPAIHFYVLFLKEYDPEKRVKRGVFYTPRPVVSYIVRSVHELLQSEFGLPEGLASTATWGEMAKCRPGLKIPQGTRADSPFVQILDPAVGTGTFLVEVIDIVHKTMLAKWEKDGRLPLEVPKLWNEYVATRLLPRLHGYELMMAPYAIAHMKIGLKLYETGYRFASNERARIYLTNSLEPPHDFSDRLAFDAPALAHEASAVNAVKRDVRFTVIVANPPYSALSANLTPENRRIIDAYRSVDGVPIRERSMLQFEKNIQDDYIKFFAISQQLIELSQLGIVGLITNHSFLDGPTLRGMRWRLLHTFHRINLLDLHGNSNKREGRNLSDENVFDIQQGVAISLLTRKETNTSNKISVGHLWGPRLRKYSFLSENTVDSTERRDITPKPDFYYFLSFESGLDEEYERFVPISKLFMKNLTGTTSGFDELLIDFNRDALEHKLGEFASKGIDDKYLRDLYGARGGQAAFVLSQRHSIDVKKLGLFIKPFQLFAFDYRWGFLRKDLLQGHRFDVMQNLGPSKPGLVAMRQTKESFGAFVASGFCGHKILASYDRSYVFPVYDLTGVQGSTFLDWRLVPQGVQKDRERNQVAAEILDYAYAVLYSPVYRRRYAEFLQIDFPRVPLTEHLDLFRELVACGNELVALHLMESPRLDRYLTKFIGAPHPEVEKISYAERTVWLDKDQTCGFRGVPEAVWNFHIGGYQICEKWLKDRKGRKLLKDDIDHYQRIVVALAETIRLMKEIDEVIEKHGGWPKAFS
jgi:predicted helicase